MIVLPNDHSRHARVPLVQVTVLAAPSIDSAVDASVTRFSPLASDMTLSDSVMPSNNDLDKQCHTRVYMENINKPTNIIRNNLEREWTRRKNNYDSNNVTDNVTVDFIEKNIGKVLNDVTANQQSRDNNCGDKGYEGAMQEVTGKENVRQTVTSPPKKSFASDLVPIAKAAEMKLLPSFQDENLSNVTVTLDKVTEVLVGKNISVTKLTKCNVEKTVESVPSAAKIDVFPRQVSLTGTGSGAAIVAVNKTDTVQHIKVRVCFKNIT